eukprot:100231_1
MAQTDILPPNWSILYTPDRQPYYQNSVTKITQWERPSIQTESAETVHAQQSSAPSTQQYQSVQYPQKIPLSSTKDEQPSSPQMQVSSEQSSVLEIDQSQENKSCCQMTQQKWKKWIMRGFAHLFVIGCILLVTGILWSDSCPGSSRDEFAVFNLCLKFSGAGIAVGVTHIIAGIMGYIVTWIINYAKCDDRCSGCKCPNCCTCDRYMQLQQKQEDVKNCCTHKCKKWALAVFAVMFIVSVSLIIAGYATESGCNGLRKYSRYGPYGGEYNSFYNCGTPASRMRISGYFFIPIGLDGTIITLITYYNKCRCLCECECCGECDKCE